jgi:hypothetical protein
MNTDPNQPAGKRGQRDRKAEPRSRKPAKQPSPKPDLQRNAKHPIDATIARADFPRVDTVAPMDTVAIDAVAPADIAAIDAIAPANIVVIDAVVPANIVAIDAVAPANIVVIDAVAPANTRSIDAVAMAVTFSFGAVAPVDTVSISLRSIASAYGDYTRKSFEQTRSFVERLKAVRSLHEAMQLQAEFATQTCETFLAESQKVCGIYSDLARQSFMPLERVVARAAQAAR